MKLDLRSVAPLATFVILAAACTAEPERDLPDVDIDSETETPVESPPAISPSIGVGVSDAPGRLAVLDDLGTLATFDPDGSNRVVLAESVEGESLVRQPTWSPDGDRLAWVRLDVSGGSANALVTAAADGTTPTESPTAAQPFYLFWDPTSSRIAYLGSSAAADIELGIVDIAAGDEPVALDAGSPFYFSWDPSGQQLFVHVGRVRLDRLDIDGSTTSVHDRPGTFDVPVWTTDGRNLVYASVRRDHQRLVAHDLEAERVEELVRFDGGITFVVSHDGNQVAHQVAEGQVVAPLQVLDRRTGVIEEVADGPVPAFFWSPEGDKLLYLLPELTPERVWFRWGVWDGESSFTTPRFSPGDAFAREYLQFFQQYAQSMSLWAPDGSAFTYSGTNESGEAGVWIQPAREGTEPVLVTEGVFAAWSPA